MKFFSRLTKLVVQDLRRVVGDMVETVIGALEKVGTVVRYQIAPLVTGALIGAGASLLGGLYGERRADKRQDQSDAMQREFAQHGVRWKVADAKAAGVHPLFALGSGGTQGYTPSPVTPSPMAEGIRDAGQNLSSAVARQETASDRQMRIAQLQAVDAQAARDRAVAFAQLSEARRTQQMMQASAPMPEFDEFAHGAIISPYVEQQIPTTRGIDNYATEQQPGWSRWSIGFYPGTQDSFQLQTPSSEEGLKEAVENAGPLYWATVVKHNVAEYGPKWLPEAARRFPGLAEAIEASGGIKNYWNSISGFFKREGSRSRESLDYYPMP